MKDLSRNKATKLVPFATRVSGIHHSTHRFEHGLVTILQSMKSLNFMIFSHKNHFYSNERSILHTYELSAIKFDDNTRDFRMPLKGQNERVINVSV